MQHRDNSQSVSLSLADEEAENNLPFYDCRRTRPLRRGAEGRGAASRDRDEQRDVVESPQRGPAGRSGRNVGTR